MGKRNIFSRILYNYHIILGVSEFRAQSRLLNFSNPVTVKISVANDETFFWIIQLGDGSYGFTAYAGILYSWSDSFNTNQVYKITGSRPLYGRPHHTGSFDLVLTASRSFLIVSTNRAISYTVEYSTSTSGCVQIA